MQLQLNGSSKQQSSSRTSVNTTPRHEARKGNNDMRLMYPRNVHKITLKNENSVSSQHTQNISRY